MISINSVQQALITKLKSVGDLTAIVGNEIRELEWQGTDFSYPSVRVRITRLVPTNSNCSTSRAFIAVYYFSEQTSSYQANDIGRIIVDNLHGKSFSSGGTKFVGFQAVQNGAHFIEEAGTWQGEVMLEVTVS